MFARYTRSILSFTGDDFNVFPSVPAAAQSVQERGELFARAEARKQFFDGRFTSVFGLSLTDYKTREQDPDLGFGAPPPNVSDGRRTAVDWQGDLKLAPGETLVLGLQDKNDELEKVGTPASDEDRSAFAELQSTPLPGLSTAVSVRADAFRREGDVTTWRAGATYVVPSTGTKVDLTAGTAFKAPTLADLFVSFPAFGFFANPDLKPERSRGYDAGFEQPFDGGRFRFGATYFDNEISDLIETSFNSTTFTSTLINVDRARAYGVETFASAKLSDRLEARADYTWTSATDLTTGLELLRRPKNAASASADWRPLDRLSFRATALYLGSWIDANRSFTIPRLNAHPFATFDIAVDYRLNGSTALFARVQNLLDRRYEDPVGFLRPPLGVFAGVRLSFEGARLR
jgi:vitamin B12 transporter